VSLCLERVITRDVRQAPKSSGRKRTKTARSSVKEKTREPKQPTSVVKK
jgi:hypothetical protein